MNPRAWRTESSVARVSNSISCCCLAGSTVNTLIRMTGLSLMGLSVGDSRSSEFPHHLPPSPPTVADGELLQAVELGESAGLAGREEDGIPAETLGAAAGVEEGAFGDSFGDDLIALVGAILVEELAAGDGAGVAEGFGCSGDALGADGQEHPLDERTGEAVQDGQLQAGLFHHHRSLERRPGGGGLATQDLQHVEGLDLGQIELRRRQIRSGDQAGLGDLAAVSGDEDEPPHSPDTRLSSTISSSTWLRRWGTSQQLSSSRCAASRRWSPSPWAIRRARAAVSSMPRPTARFRRVSASHSTVMTPSKREA